MKLSKSRLQHYWTASIIPDIAPKMIFYVIFSALICLLDYLKIPVQAPNLPFFAAVSIVVGFLLVFRTNTAYDRFWEGRRLWAQMTTASRNFARMVSCEIEGDTHIEPLRNLILTMKAFKNCLREEARKKYVENCMKGLAAPPNSRNLSLDFVESGIAGYPFLSENERRPFESLKALSVYVTKQRNTKTIDAAQAGFLELQLGALTDAYTQCQRISRTPIPPAYEIHLQHIVFLYCIAFPFSIVGQFKWWSIVISAIVFYVILGVKSIGKEIENPFGDDYNDLPLELFCSALEKEFSIYSVDDRSKLILNPVNTNVSNSTIANPVTNIHTMSDDS